MINTTAKFLCRKAANTLKPSAAGGTVPWFKDGKELVVLSLNMEYYHKYCAAKDKASYRQYLTEKLEGVDALCTQEDLLVWSDKFLEEGQPFDAFRRIASSIAQPDIKNSKLKDMLYEDEAAMETIKMNGIKDDELYSNLGNSIYLNKSSAWSDTDHEVVQISTEMTLPSGKPLGYRSVVCATLAHAETERPVRLLCTHLSGGRFEDAYMGGGTKRERADQMDRCLARKAGPADNVLVGDFNAAVERTEALDGYLGALRGGRQPDLSTSDYYSFMMSPFTALAKDGTRNWNLLYKNLGGPTSAFGDITDFFVTSPQMYVQTPFGRPPKMERIRMIKDYMPWIQPTADEDLPPEDNSTVLKEPITDHNGVKVTFFQPTKHITTAEITFHAAEHTVWASAVGGAEWDEIVKALRTSMAGAEEAKPTRPGTVYPVLEYTDSPDGPALSRDDAPADLVTLAQRPALEKFLTDPTPAALEIFARDCAAAERRALTGLGWWVEEGWYSVTRRGNSLRFRERMTAAHKSLHGEVMSVRVLRALVGAKMLIRG